MRILVPRWFLTVAAFALVKPSDTAPAAIPRYDFRGMEPAGIEPWEVSSVTLNSTIFSKTAVVRKPHERSSKKINPCQVTGMTCASYSAPPDETLFLFAPRALGP